MRAVLDGSLASRELVAEGSAVRRAREVAERAESGAGGR